MSPPWVALFFRRHPEAHFSPPSPLWGSLVFAMKRMARPQNPDPELLSKGQRKKDGERAESRGGKPNQATRLYANLQSTRHYSQLRSVNVARHDCPAVAGKRSRWPERGGGVTRGNTSACRAARRNNMTTYRQNNSQNHAALQLEKTWGPPLRYPGASCSLVAIRGHFFFECRHP